MNNGLETRYFLSALTGAGYYALHRQFLRPPERYFCILKGGPGCGKSTVGAALAKRLDKKFVDLDAEIERRTGHNIPDIFAQEGEAAFRRYETDVLAEVAKSNSQVIALREDVLATLPQCREVQLSDCRTSLPGTLLDSVLRLLSPLM